MAGRPQPAAQGLIVNMLKLYQVFCVLSSKVHSSMIKPLCVGTADRRLQMKSLWEDPFYVLNVERISVVAGTAGITARKAAPKARLKNLPKATERISAIGFL